MVGAFCMPARGEPAATGDERAAPTMQRLSGIVKRYVINEFGDVEGLMATDGTQVRFPPHMGGDLTGALKPGDPFIAEGEGNPNAAFRAYTIGKPGGPPLTEARPSASARSVSRDVRNGALAAIDVDGVVEALLHAPRGEVDGVVLTDGTIVRLPPRGRPPGLATLRVGARVTATGLGTSNRYGRCIRADRMGVDGEPPMPLQPRGPQSPPAGERDGPGKSPPA